MNNHPNPEPQGRRFQSYFHHIPPSWALLQSRRCLSDHSSGISSGLAAHTRCHHRHPSVASHAPFCWLTDTLLLAHRHPSVSSQTPFCWPTDTLLSAHPSFHVGSQITVDESQRLGSADQTPFKSPERRRCVSLKSPTNCLHEQHESQLCRRRPPQHRLLQLPRPAARWVVSRLGEPLR